MGRQSISLYLRRVNSCTRSNCMDKGGKLVPKAGCQCRYEYTYVGSRWTYLDAGASIDGYGKTHLR